MRIPKGKWISGFWPMIFISFSTGSVYCWTLFREDIVKWGGTRFIGYCEAGIRQYQAVFTQELLTLCFMLALFFLGMTAAFGGKLVERSVKRASLYTFIFFTLGWIITGIGIYARNPILTVVGFGPIQGIGLGLGYLTPIKTLMMWFDDRKGFAAGIALAAFTLAGLLGNPTIGFLLQFFTVYQAFLILTALYGVLCFIAYIIIDRPPLKAEDEAAKTYSAREVIFSKKFIFLWVVLFLNIAAGLALMSHEQQIYIMLGLDSTLNRALIVLFATVTGGGGNLVGRIIMASSQDKTNNKHFPYYLISIVSIITCVVAIFLMAPGQFVMGFVIIFIIQFFFGAGFACLPCVLEQHWGMKQLATIQGYILTAWAIAALIGPQIAIFILELADPITGTPAVLSTLNMLYVALAGMFVVQFIFLLLFVRAGKKDGTIKAA